MHEDGEPPTGRLCYFCIFDGKHARDGGASEVYVEHPDGVAGKGQ
jgi:hypothetical protein